MTLKQRRLNVDATSWRCIDIEPTLYKRHVPIGLISLYYAQVRKQLYRNICCMKSRAEIVLQYICLFDTIYIYIVFF